MLRKLARKRIWWNSEPSEKRCRSWANYLTGNGSVPPALVPSKQFYGFIKKLKKDSFGNTSPETSRSFDIRWYRKGGGVEQTIWVRIYWWKRNGWHSHYKESIPVCRKFTSTVTALQSFFQISRRTKPQDRKVSHPVILKMFATILAQPLTHIFNKTLTSGTLPSDWLTANISPIIQERGQNSSG